MALANEELVNNHSGSERNNTVENQFCGQCGKFLQMGQKFCSACGSKVAVASTLKNNIDWQVQQGGEILYSQKKNENRREFIARREMLLDKFLYRKIEVVGEVISLVVCIFFFAVLWYVRLQINSKMPGGIFDINGNKTVAIAICNLLLVITLVEAIITIVAIFVDCKMYLSVFEDRISGVARKNYLFTEAFEVQYSEILNIKLIRGGIRVETTNKIYKCVISREREAYELIKKRINIDDNSPR